MNVLKIKGNNYPLKFSINAMIEFEELSGKSFSQIGDNMSLANIRLLFYVGLKAGGNDVNELQAGMLMNDYVEDNGMEKFGEILSKSAVEALGKNKAKPPEKKQGRVTR